MHRMGAIQTATQRKWQGDKVERMTGRKNKQNRRRGRSSPSYFLYPSFNQVLSRRSTFILLRPENQTIWLRRDKRKLKNACQCLNSAFIHCKNIQNGCNRCSLLYQCKICRVRVGIPLCRSVKWMDTHSIGYICIGEQRGRTTGIRELMGDSIYRENLSVCDTIPQQIQHIVH